MNTLKITNRNRLLTERHDLDFRLSCNLLNGAVNSWKAVKEYMNFYEDYGIISFLFREIMPRKEHPAVADIVKEMKREQVSEHEPGMECEQEPEQKKGMEQKIDLIKTAHGMFYDVDIYGYGEKLIKHYKGKTGNTQNKKADQSEKRLITFLVYEEGELRTKW